jgi:hypothetical protein
MGTVGSMEIEMWKNIRYHVDKGHRTRRTNWGQRTRSEKALFAHSLPC